MSAAPDDDLDYDELAERAAEAEYEVNRFRLTDEQWATLEAEFELKNPSEYDINTFGLDRLNLDLIVAHRRKNLEEACAARLKKLQTSLADDPKEESKLLTEFANAGRELLRAYAAVAGRSESFYARISRNMRKNMPGDIFADGCDPDNYEEWLDCWMRYVEQSVLSAEDIAQLVQGHRKSRKPEQRAFLHGLCWYWRYNLNRSGKRNIDPYADDRQLAIKAELARFLQRVPAIVFGDCVTPDQADHAIRTFDEVEARDKSISGEGN